MTWSRIRGMGSLIGLIIFFMLVAQSAIGADTNDQTIKVISNRNDVSFFVRSGTKNYKIPPTLGSAASRERPPVELTVYVNELRAKLQQQFQLATDEIHFAKFCGVADDGTHTLREICRTFGTLKPGNKLDFYFYPDTSPSTMTGKTIIIKDSYCVIVGSNNMQTCRR